MNTQYFNTERERAIIRIDTLKGSMKGYAKASELKSKSKDSPRRTPSLGFGTSFPSEVSLSSRQISSSKSETSYPSSAENYSPQSSICEDKPLGGGLFNKKCEFCFDEKGHAYWCDIGGDNPNWTSDSNAK